MWIQPKKTEAFKAKNLDKLGMFLTFKTMQAFIKLRKVFVKALILNHFYLKYYIYIKTYASDYAIS